MKRYILFALLLSVGHLKAQFKHCGRLLQQGDTTICQYIRDGKIRKEHFYLGQERIFTRRWVYATDQFSSCIGPDSFYWEQRTSKGKHAKRNGPAEYYYGNGVLRYATFYRHGKNVGPSVAYYPSGVVHYTCERYLSNGKVDGRENEYHQNGAIASKRIYKNGRLSQILTYKDKQGEELPIGTFENGNGDVFSYSGRKPVMAYTYRKGKIVRYKRISLDGEEED